MNTIILHSTPLEELREMIREEISKGLAEYFSKNPNTPNNLPKYWARKETAEYLKVSEQTLLDWTKSGRIKCYYISRRVYYKPEEIEAAMTERTARIRK